MAQTKTAPIVLDFKDIRSSRQRNNNKIVYNSIKTKNMKMFYDSINEKEFERTLQDLEFTCEEFFKKCNEDDKFCIVICRLISKNASRQGAKDETEQLRTCNITSQQYGINIRNLTATELRPTKDGQILTVSEMKQNKVQKDCCLKSFDGKIEGVLNGFIAAKVAFGSGGHQDNVFEEMDTIAEWWKNYKCGIEETLIVLIDTDLKSKFDRLKEKYNNINNIMFCNHIEFQQFVIDTYHTDASI